MCKHSYDDSRGASPCRRVGLECGGFAPKNPALDMISIGPTLTCVHTPEERCNTEDVRITLELLKGILRTLNK